MEYRSCFKGRSYLGFVIYVICFYHLSSSFFIFGWIWWSPVLMWLKPLLCAWLASRIRALLPTLLLEYSQVNIADLSIFPPFGISIIFFPVHLGYTCWALLDVTPGLTCASSSDGYSALCVSHVDYLSHEETSFVDLITWMHLYHLGLDAQSFNLFRII